MNVAPILLLLFGFSFISANLSSRETAVWHRLRNQAVSAYKVLMSALSATSITCVRECMKHSQCDSSAFDRESGTCYLQVEPNTTTEATVTLVDVYTEFVPCLSSQRHLDVRDTNITWRRNGWEMEGDVKCDDDYMYIGDSPSFRCSATGQWTVNWECRQRIWRSPRVYDRFSVPKTLEPGWTVCVHGTPTNISRFTLNLASDEDIVLHVDVRLNFHGFINRFALTHTINGAWAGPKFYPMDPFPISVNQTFKLVVKALTLSDVELFVDGALIGNYTTSLTLDKVTEVFAEDDVAMDTLDLWCDQ